MEILEELGVDAFTTSLLAERAGLGIRNVYRYFPNRLAVIAALAERMADEQERSVDGFAELADPEAPWRDALARSVGSFVRALAAEPALAAVRTAMRTAPALRAIDEASDRRLAAALAAALRKRGVRRAPARLEVAGMVLMTALGAVIERTLLDESWSPEDAVRESVALAAGYLAPLMDTSAGTRRARRS